jgi:hypothetical protein
MPTAAIIGGAASLGGAFLTSSAAQKASEQQVATANQAIGVQQDIFNQIKNMISPVVSKGTDVFNTALAPLAKLLTPGPDMTETLKQLPGFQFASDWGQRGVAAQATTRGLGGNALAEGAKFATGLASTNFGNLITPLLDLLKTGGNLMTSPLGPFASAGGTASSNIGSTLGELGKSEAAGTLGSANALAGGLTGAANSVTNAMLFNKLFPGGGGMYGGTPQLSTAVGGGG